MYERELFPSKTNIDEELFPANYSKSFVEWLAIISI